MTDWQQGLDSRLVRRLEQPLNRKNIGQVLVDRTDRFLTRFSLVEQQLERWGKFQESNPSAVPIVYARPTMDPPDFVTSFSKGGNGSPSFVGGNEAIAQSPSLNSPVMSGNQDLVIQRRVESGGKADEAIAQPASPVTNQSGRFKATGDPPGSATPLWKGGNVNADFIDSSGDVPPPPETSTSSADILIQRFVDPAAPLPTTDFSPTFATTNVVESSPNYSSGSHSIVNTSSSNNAVVLVETSKSNFASIQDNNLPLVESNQSIDEVLEDSVSISSSEFSSESVEAIPALHPQANNSPSIDLALTQNKSANKGDAVVIETEMTRRSPNPSDLTFVTLGTQTTQSSLGEGGRRPEGVMTSYLAHEETNSQVQSFSRENQTGDRLESPIINTASQIVINGEETIETTRFTDVPLVFALPNNPEQSVIATEVQASTETVLPIVKTRLEQLLSRPRKPSQLQTVAPQNLVQRSPQKTTTPLVQPLPQPKTTDSESMGLPMPTTHTSVQPQPVGNPENASNHSLPLTQTKIIQTERRSPTPPNPTNPFTSSTQAPVPIVSPQIREAANPITETFQAAMAEATQQPPVDIQAIANQVEKKLRKKMVIERERRGQGRWR